MDNFLETLKGFLPYLSALMLSSWGGIVHYLQSIRVKKKPFSMRELSFDLVVSSFAGLLTFYFCQWSQTGEAISAILIATSGHMGTRAIARFETIHTNIFKQGKDNE